MTHRHRIEQRQLAYDLLANRLRPQIVHLHTRIRVPVLREMYKELHDTSPPSGQLPSIKLLLGRNIEHIYCSIFAKIYLRHVNEDPSAEIDVPSLLKAWLDFRTVAPNAEIPRDLTDAWVIVRNVRMGTIVFKQCPACSSNYLILAKTEPAKTCPICRRRENGASRPRRSSTRGHEGDGPCLPDILPDTLVHPESTLPPEEELSFG